MQDRIVKHEIGAALLTWFHTHRRPLPWRTPRGVRRDPWQTLVSEVMSQQTRLEVVVPRFIEWMAQFPTPAHLAQASEQEVLAAWAGMGYYSRARNLQKAAQAVAERGWPSDHAGFLALPGVGPYTAAALASLCCGEQVPMIDGNVLRVLSRVHALGQDLRSGVGKRLLESLAQEWIKGGDAGEINEATMELGALVCLPKNPKCGECPLSETCKACTQGDPERFPQPKRKTESVNLVRDVAIIHIDGNILLRPSRPDELLRGLLVPPDLSEIPQPFQVVYCGEVRHAITHHKVLWKVHRAGLDNFRLPEEWFSVPQEELPLRVVSSLVRKALTLAGVWPPQT
jgi:A/G-specific adenine glycosylase